jgi:hypothetical protein
VTYACVTLGTCDGFDTSTKLTTTQAHLAAISYRFVARYVFFGDALKGDIDPTELAAICNAGLVLLLVQHPRNPGWMASQMRGMDDGEAAARNAAEAGYLQGCHLFLDLEGLGNSGPPVRDHAIAWCSAVRSAGYWPGIYVGFDAGLTPDELWELPNVDRYWSDAGPRSVSRRGFCLTQGSTETFAGIPIDPDHHAPDKLGGCLVGMGLGINERPTDPELPTA